MSLLLILLQLVVSGLALGLVWLLYGRFDELVERAADDRALAKLAWRLRDQEGRLQSVEGRLSMWTPPAGGPTRFHEAEDWSQDLLQTHTPEEKPQTPGPNEPDKPKNAFKRLWELTD